MFAAYLVVFAWLVTRVRFFTKSGLTNPQLVILFLLKVMAGIFYGWIGVYYGEMAQMIDTWAYHAESIQEYHNLMTHPVQFFTGLFHTYEGGYSNFLTTQNSWWNDVKANFLIKVMAIFNLFSFGHYYINVIFYSFLTLFGPVAIFRVMQDVYPGRKGVLLAATFLIPSFLYWTSGIHKEGLIFTGMGLMVYHFYFGFKEGRFRLYRILLILLGFVLVLILRNFLILTLVPPLLGWIIAEKWKYKASIVFAILWILSIVVFFTARYVNPKFDFPAATVIKQQEFLKLGGGSAINVNELQPTFRSFVRNTPQALSMTLLRPFPSDVKHLLSLAAAAEISVLLVLFLAFLFFRRKGGSLTPFLWFCLSLAFGIILMVGYTVNILGAIVRYRSIIFPFLLVPVIASIDWQRLTRLILPGIKNKNNV
jgi:hypothetical protein